MLLAPRLVAARRRRDAASRHLRPRPERPGTVEGPGPGHVGGLGRVRRHRGCPAAPAPPRSARPRGRERRSWPLVAISRIYGVAWPYLMLWAYGIGALMLLAIGATLVLAAVRWRPELSRPRATTALSGAGLLMVAALSVRLLVVAPDASTETPDQTEQLGRLVPDTVAALEDGTGASDGRGGRYLVTWSDATNGGSEGIGLVNELIRRGFDVGVEADEGVKMGAPPRSRPGRRHGADRARQRRLDRAVGVRARSGAHRLRRPRHRRRTSGVRRGASRSHRGPASSGSGGPRRADRHRPVRRGPQRGRRWRRQPAASGVSSTSACRSRCSCSRPRHRDPPRSSAPVGASSSVGFALRLGWALYARGEPPADWRESGDQFSYWHYGNEIARGRGYISYVTGDGHGLLPDRVPGPARARSTSSCSTRPIPDNLMLATALLHVALGTASIWLTFVVGRAVAGVRVGLLAAGAPRGVPQHRLPGGDGAAGDGVHLLSCSRLWL